jgi:tRNA-Thr(GGU) m(6)t(6)A37 methyltransferase TsaA
MTPAPSASLRLEPIGIVRNAVHEGVDHGWSDVVSEIQVRPEWSAGLRGLESFSHVVVVFFMHDARFQPASDLLRRPRGRDDMPLVGSFAQRAKHRPNPIGITIAKLEQVGAGVLVVRGLDAIDGTPVLDLKPHVPAFDAPAGATVPAWMERLMEGYF